MSGTFVPVTSDNIVIRDAGEGPATPSGRFEDPTPPPDSALNARQVNPSKEEKPAAPTSLSGTRRMRMQPVTERIEGAEEQDFSPARYKMQISERTGRVTLEPRESPAQEEAEAEGESPDVEDGTPESVEASQFSASPESTPTETTAADPVTARMDQFQNAMMQMAHTMQFLMQQVTGRQAPATPAEPPEPEYAKYDLSDPAELDAYIQLKIEQGVNARIAPTNNQVAQIEARRQIDDLIRSHGQEVFDVREPLLAELAKANPGTSAKDLWAMAERLAPLPKSATATQPAAKPPARTLTADQAKQKQQQAAKLPRTNAGVSGVGKAGLPPNIRKFGDILAYNMMTGRAGN